MGMISIEGKSVSLPDSIIDAGDAAIRAALAVDFPDVENAQITINKPNGGAPAIVTSRSATVVKRSTPKG